MINKQLIHKSAKVGRIFLMIGVALLTAVALGLVYVRKVDRPLFPPAKARLIALQEQEIATARAHPRNKQNARPPVLPADLSPMPTPQAGIFETHQGPFEPIDFTVRNVWQGPVGSVWETVFAGGTPKDRASGNSTPGPGALRIYTDHPFDLVKIVMAPKGNGPLTITAVNGTTMQLRTDEGKALTFDLQNDQFN